MSTVLLVVVAALSSGAVVYFIFRFKIGSLQKETNQHVVDLAVARKTVEDHLSCAAKIDSERLQISELSQKLASADTRVSEQVSAHTAAIARLDGDKANLSEELAQMRSDFAVQGESRINLEKSLAESLTSIEEREKALFQERQLIDNFKEQFKSQFAELSVSALKENRADFLATAKQEFALQKQDAESALESRKKEIDQLVTPIREGLTEISKAAREMEEKRERAFGGIEEQMRSSILAAGEIAKEASALKDALKKPTVRGRWGEVQLHNCVELAGMEEHCDVEFQETSTDDDGEKLRPDMIVRMPGGRKIAVDAKTPLQHFLEYLECTTDEARKVCLSKHGAAVKVHISNLIKADYMKRISTSPDFVVMFLPNESFLAMALEYEPSIIEDALAKKVLIATPGTLIGLLKVIRYGWNEEKLAKNAAKIAHAGKALNTEISRFVEDFVKIESSLAAASEALHSSKRRVENQIAKAASNLTRLGAPSKKVLKGKAAELLQIDPEEDAPEEMLALAAEVESGEEDEVL